MRGNSLKLAVSAVILIVGLALTVIAVGISSSTENPSGIIIDFGDYETVYTASDGALSPFEALESACDRHGLDIVSDGSVVTSIDGRVNTATESWSVFGVEKGSSSWTSLGMADSVTLSDYSVVCYGYLSEGAVPAPAVDRTGHIIYDYKVPERIVSLAPSCTESICYAGGTDLIVGTDQYSNYPTVIEERQDAGDIAIVGGFTNPSYEAILKQNPDLVICISSQNAHMQMADRLRAVGIDVLVLDGGESIESIMNNQFELGVVLGKQSEAAENISELQGQLDSIANIIDSYDFKWDKRVMVALSAAKSPWVSGSGTYVSDILSYVGVNNIYSGESGWVQVNAETIAKYNPEVILIFSTDYEATQSSYDSMVDSMSSEWKGTDAYKNGEIYLFTGDAADCASRASPRIVQLAELVGRAVQGAAFDDGIVLPKFIGDDYTEYLRITGGQ